MRACEVAKCKKPATSRGMCMSHYAKWYRKEHPDYEASRKYPCRLCGKLTSSTDHCAGCRHIADRMKRDKWERQELQHSVYYRRTLGKCIVRVYDGPTVRWEVERGRVRQGIGKTVVDAMRHAVDRANHVESVFRRIKNEPA